MAKSTSVTIGGKSYDANKLEDAPAIQATLIPPNFPGTKRDGVKLYLALQAKLKRQFARHLAYNFSQIMRTALEEKEEPGGVAIVPVSFGFEINLTAISVAAIGKTKMRFSRKYTSEGKPEAEDINQMKFLDDDDELALDVKAFEKEQEEEPEKPEKEGEGKPGKKKRSGKMAAAGDDSGDDEKEPGAVVQMTPADPKK